MVRKNSNPDSANPDYLLKTVQRAGRRTETCRIAPGIFTLFFLLAFAPAQPWAQPLHKISKIEAKMERRASPAQTFVADPEQYSASLLLLKEVGLNQSQERIITLWALRYAHSNEHIRVQRQTQNIAAGSKSSESTTTPGQEEQRSQTEARTQEFTKNKAGTETSFPASEYRRAVEVVEEQLDAIRDRDAHKIWQGMSENLQSSFRSPNEALADIRLNQKPLYGHLSYQLIESMERDENLIQKVELIGKNGRRVLSFFSLQKAKNGVWKINRITILDPKSQAI